MTAFTIAPDILSQFLANLFCAKGMELEPAVAIARNMVWSELAGRTNYGLERVPIHIRRLCAGVLSGVDAVTIRELGPSLVQVDGGGGPGQYAAERAMAAAIDKGRATDTPVTLCGELASKPIGALALVALGYRALSLTPSSLGPVKSMLLELDAKKAADTLLPLIEKPDTAGSIRKELQAFAEAEGLQL